MLPLGDLWTGVCEAQPGEPAKPDRAGLRHLCNLGYARGSCPRFPRDGGADAVRFAVKAHAADAVRLYYVVERDHLPLAHGPLEYSETNGSLTPPPEDRAVARLSQAYAQSYLRRVQETVRK